jgi:hypothetical protein
MSAMRITFLSRSRFRALAAAVALATSQVAVVQAQLVPGTGELVTEIGDDFEDPEWNYIPNNPKGSKDYDGQRRNPQGFSENRRWFEGPDRGQPDVVKRIETPADGIEGSEGALLISSRYTGTPNRGGRERAQDDLFMHVGKPFGGAIPVSHAPSTVVRVHVPSFEEWEQRFGSSFGFRATVRGTKSSTGKKTEPYWPGMFFQFNPRGKGGKPQVYLVIRARESGQDYMKVPVKGPGWWTLGMSFTPDGRIHYYAHAGVEDLTEKDHLASHHPYNFRCTQFKMVFFDVFNENDGQNWSTGWVIDDPAVYIARGNLVVRNKSSNKRS